MNRRELEQAIKECEQGKDSYQNCEKLATFYTIQDHLYSEAKPRTEVQDVIGDYGDSEFLLAVQGKDAEKVWAVMDELAEVLKAINPSLYNGIIRKLAD